MLFIYLWLCWVFIAAQAFLQLRQAGATLQLWSAGFSLWWPLLAEHRPYREWASVVAVSGLWSTGEIVTAHRLIALWRVGSFRTRD